MREEKGGRMEEEEGYKREEEGGGRKEVISVSQHEVINTLCTDTAHASIRGIWVLLATILLD